MLSSNVYLHTRNIALLLNFYSFYSCILGNEVSRIEGLDGLVRLTELVLDRNKVKALLPNSLTSLSRLRELHLEENRS